MKLLVLDIETSPHKGWFWGCWDQNIGLNQVEKPGEILCFAARFVGEKKMHFHSSAGGNTKKMLQEAHKLLDECDALIGWNSRRFDAAWLNGQFLVHGMKPPSPYKHIDLMETSKRKFKLMSNKLEYVATALKIGHKKDTGGFTLWREVMEEKPHALKKMKAYNIQDVELTEKVYARFLPYIANHPNVGTYNQSGIPTCVHCGSGKLQSRGWARTLVNMYQRFQCMACGAWNRSGATEFKKDDRAKLLRPVIN